MKSKAKLFKKKHAGNTPDQAAVPAPQRSLRGTLICVAGALVVGVGTWAVFELVVWNTIPAELVGKWEVVESPKEYSDGTFEFFKNGKMVGRININGRLGIIDATIHVDGKKIHSTSTSRETGERTTSVFVIRMLTDRKLVVEDQQGGLMKMRRAL